ncbi:cell division inhibitor MciZ-like protein [Cytobacillus horneckiae]|uniref:Z-ring formation inhibitor MciZ n=2 Tax=Bacteria TaxID=2 RepID=A0A2N0Z8G1_9BACI|nr:Z-ring formation inhibitor MciZ [Cytobacillus horneckiae]NRG44450.1 Z-ring formation inhibitor MciZ [Bacillus sp. CRN 9]MBN6888341.1 Z-ring formation inhibitor MciZ [Cytobacillus horneckiae]MCM3180065.1 Z-ring formation inhibitor MciZ [Cytobacillus horneckiae]MEC1155482.1 Z-ring formation inhibitor MciZ [Cytobacillus horneckiae]MED2940602.1 Z-ring formation inhibitor MciZ [Cytobacillus horneckiae]
MKIYIHDKGVILVGKAWQIRAKLKEYQNYYRDIKEWVDSTDIKTKNR